MKGKGSQVGKDIWHQNYNFKTPISKPKGADFDINIGFIFSPFKPYILVSKSQ